MLLFPVEMLSEATLLGSGPRISVAESASGATSERPEIGSQGFSLVSQEEGLFVVLKLTLE